MDGQTRLPLLIYTTKTINFMGWSFRKSFKVAPGIRINLSKSGPSVSVGGRGGSVNVSKRGTNVNTGLPGTGLRYRQRVGGGCAIYPLIGLGLWAAWLLA
jgi:hypothetical protein